MTLREKISKMTIFKLKLEQPVQKSLLNDSLNCFQISFEPQLAVWNKYRNDNFPIHRNTRDVQGHVRIFVLGCVT